MSSSLENILVKKLMRDQGVPEDEAKEYIAAISEGEGESGIQNWMKILGENLPTLQRVPKEAQKEILTMLTADQMLGSRKNRESPTELAERLAVIKAALRPEKGEGDSEVNKKIDALQDIVLSMKEEKDKAMLEDLKKDFSEKLEAIEAKLSTGASPQDTRDEITKLADETEAIDQKRRALRRAMGLPEEEAAPATLTQSQMVEQLKKTGYKVEGPASIEDVEKRLQAKFEEERKKIKEEAKKEAEQKTRGLEILADLGGSIIETALPLFGKGGGENAMKGITSALKSAAAST